MGSWVYKNISFRINDLNGSFRIVMLLFS